MAIDLTPTPEDDDNNALTNLNKFVRVIRDQDDHAMVLSLAAFIEDLLGRLLLAYFRDCKATRALVDGFNAPLGTLSSRIKAAYAFGLVNEEQFKDMEIVRAIRNRHAHNWEGATLADPDIKAMIGQLSGYTFDHQEIEGVGRKRLLQTLSSVCVELQFFVNRLVDGKAVKAPDVSHRLTTVAPTSVGGILRVQ